MVFLSPQGKIVMIVIRLSILIFYYNIENVNMIQSWLWVVIDKCDRLSPYRCQMGVSRQFDSKLHETWDFNLRFD